MNNRDISISDPIDAVNLDDLMELDIKILEKEKKRNQSNYSNSETVLKRRKIEEKILQFKSALSDYEERKTEFLKLGYDESHLDRLMLQNWPDLFMYVSLLRIHAYLDIFSSTALTVAQFPNITVDLTLGRTVGDLKELNLEEMSVGRVFDVNNPDDVQALIMEDHLDAYLPHPFIPNPSVVIKPVYAIQGSKGVFAVKDITRMEEPLGDYLGEWMEHPGSLYIYATAKGSIDAFKQRGLMGYLNHSSNPNVRVEERSDGVVRFYPKRPIRSGEQLTFYYGDDYFRYSGFSQCFLHKSDDEYTDAACIEKNKLAYYPHIIAWNKPELQLFFAGMKIDPTQEIYYVVPKLFFAILNNEIEYVKILLDQSPPDICAYAVKKAANGFEVLPPQNQEHLTPLMLASYLGHVDIIKLLIDNGADMNRQMLQSGHSPLSLIIDGNYPKTDLADYLTNQKHEYIEIVEHLLRQKTKFLNFLLQTPLRDQTISIINKILNPAHKKEQIHLKTVLHKAVYTLNLEIFKTAPFPIVDAIWRRIVDKTYQEIVTPIKTSNMRFKSLDSIYRARQRRPSITTLRQTLFSSTTEQYRTSKTRNTKAKRGLHKKKVIKIFKSRHFED